MGKTKVVELSIEQRAALEKDYRKGTSHAFRLRCQMVLLKSEKRSSLAVADVLDCCEIVVNNWLRRYEKEGLDGLQTRKGRGRKPKLSTQNPVHLQTVKAEIARHPQSVKTVVAKVRRRTGLGNASRYIEALLKK